MPPIGGPEGLEHGQERVDTGGAEPLEGTLHNVAAVHRHHELPLEESPGAVHAVPVTDHVEGVEELPLQAKTDMAARILDRVHTLLQASTAAPQLD